MGSYLSASHNRVQRLTGVLGIFFILAGQAKADVYQCGEAEEGGVISLSNIGQSGQCKKMVLQPKPKNRPAFQPINETKEPNGQSGGARPNSSEALAERRRILDEEIELEKRRLKEASATVRDLERSVESKDKQRAILSARQKEALHQSNVRLLEKEKEKI